MILLKTTMTVIFLCDYVHASLLFLRLNSERFTCSLCVNTVSYLSLAKAVSLNLQGAIVRRLRDALHLTKTVQEPTNAGLVCNIHSTS